MIGSKPNWLITNQFFPDRSDQFSRLTLHLVKFQMATKKTVSPEYVQVTQFVWFILNSIEQLTIDSLNGWKCLFQSLDDFINL
jgi:hypothetical protein